jgi:subtilisin family serine protease
MDSQGRLQVSVGGKFAISAAVVGLLLSTVTPVAATSTGTSGPGGEPGLATVTLITGDQVIVRDGVPRSVRPAQGREGVTFSRFTADGHSYVVPADARQLVASGRFDQRLFDITTLVDFGYDDTHRDTLPLIVTHPDDEPAPLFMNATSTRELPSINGIAVTTGKDTATAMWDTLTDGDTVSTTAAGVSNVWLDGQRTSTLDRSTAQIGAPAAWEAGVTGEGVKVAVLDTGVDQTHPDLADREIAEANFSESSNNDDVVGHGTHVASTVAGTGAKSDGKYRGVAHGASILDGKVLDDSGYGQDSWVLAGMEWAAQEGADIVNLSLGGPDSTAVDPLEQAVEALTEEHGTLFVIAAGNNGPEDHTITSPGSAPAALTVGAVDREDELADFSSRGPTEQDGVIKPDVTAPGVGIVAALHSAGTIGTPEVEGYTALSGTSMATPHVAGAAALLVQQRPDWTPQQLKSALSATAVPNPERTAFEQGAGRIDVARALEQTVLPDPSAAHLGTVPWPHDDDEPVSKTITYRNLGDEDVALTLTVEATDPEGTPTDVFSLSAGEVTVPAGGEAPVTVTGDTGLGTVDGVYSGAVVATTKAASATADDEAIRTPVVVTREVESYDLTLNYTDEHGAPTGVFGAVVAGLDVERTVLPYDADGSVTVRLPKGRYFAEHLVLTERNRRHNTIVQPGIQLDRDISVDVDPTIAKPVSVTPPSAAELELADLGYQVDVGGVPVLTGGPLAFDLSMVSTAQLGEALPDTPLRSWVNTQWTGEDGAYYGLAWFLDAYPTGFTRTVAQSELATVNAKFGPGAEGDRGMRFVFPQPASGSALTQALGLPVSLPGTRVEYVNTDGLRWGSLLRQYSSDSVVVAQFESPARSYRAGRAYSARVNHPVFGPGPTGLAGYRTADSIEVLIPLFTDGDGNTGFSVTESGSTKLYRNDELVGESLEAGSGSFAGLPAEAGEYRLTTEAVRPARFDLTTSVSAEWTFSSSRAGAADLAALDLNVVRFSPKLDENGSAPSGKRFLVPMRFQDETGTAERPWQLEVEVSYDEGASWRRVPVTPNLVATLHHPTRATSVSLRASASDPDGNTVKQTVIRAYRLR